MDALERLQLALERELDGHHGRKGEVDRQLGHYEGFLRRKIANGFNVKLGELFGALGALELDPAEFLARAFDISPGAEDLLRRQEKPGPPSRSLASIESAAFALEARPAPAKPSPQPTRQPATRSRQQLESFVRTGLGNQRNIVRKQSWVRDSASLRRYLELLDGLRFDRAQDAAALAETVAVELVAKVACPQDGRLELLCHAIGAFASAKRVVGEFATAARAVGFALRLAGRHGLIAARACLLQRGGYVLRDTGCFDHALEVLDEALVLWAEQDRPADFGKTMVDRAIIFGHKGEILRADRIFKIGLNYLSGDTESHRIFRLAAAHGIAFTQLRIGDTEVAEQWLQRAIELVRDDEPSALGKLIRQKGEIFFQRGNFPAAERAFSHARRLLEAKENAIQGAFVALDLAAALAAQGKIQQVKKLAKEMNATLTLLTDNKIAEAALMHFIRAGLEGRVSEQLIEDVGKKLGRTRPLARARPIKSSHPDR